MFVCIAAFPAADGGDWIMVATVDLFLAVLMGGTFALSEGLLNFLRCTVQNMIGRTGPSMLLLIHFLPFATTALGRSGECFQQQV